MALKRKPFDWSTAQVTACMIVAAIVVYLRDGQARFVAVFLNDAHIFLDILPKMAAGCLIGVFPPCSFGARWWPAGSAPNRAFLALIATAAGVVSASSGASSPRPRWRAA